MSPGTFQGGGTVSALMVAALERGLIEAAVLTETGAKGPVACMAASPQAVSACSTSKFTAAPTLSALNAAACAGQRNLGLVGTPCQVTAVAKMRLNSLNRTDYRNPVSLMVGLFCSWALDQRGFYGFLSHRMDVSTIRRIDIPPPPANILAVDLGQAAVQIPLDQVRPFIRETCRLCPDMTSEWADVSVGMLEGRPGWNTLIVRSQTGQALVEAAEATDLLRTQALPHESLDRLKTAAAAKKIRAFAALQQRGLLNTDAEGTRAVLRVPADVVNRILSAGQEDP
jgi:coenzyme F420 hydrogenase subunit beta